MFATVLVANRGEIAVRVIRTLRRARASAPSPSTATPTPTRGTCARPTSPCASARRRRRRATSTSTPSSPRPARTGAQAVHPGYGFLVRERGVRPRPAPTAGLVFVGPPAAAIEAMGDKIRAKQTVEAAGVAVVPGVHTPGLTDDDLVAAADDDRLPRAAQAVRRWRRQGHAPRRRPRPTCPTPWRRAAPRGRTAFGDDTLLVERFVDRPRHIEVQVLADAHGTCSTSASASAACSAATRRSSRRRPSPLLTDDVRAARSARAPYGRPQACGYVGAGTVEFIVGGDRPDEFFFMEMNTRLQVEHPVTELVTGLDLVELQLRVAAGERAAVDAGRRPPGRSRGRGPDLRRGPGARLPAHRGHGARASVEPSGRARPGRLRHQRRVGGRVELRPDARQGHRLGDRPRRGARPARRGARPTP